MCGRRIARLYFATFAQHDLYIKVPTGYRRLLSRLSLHTDAAIGARLEFMETLGPPVDFSHSGVSESNLSECLLTAGRWLVGLRNRPLAGRFSCIA